MAGQKMGSKGEKTNFSLACRLLSQYLKEKCSVGGLGLEMAPPKPLDQQAQGMFLSDSFGEVRSFPSKLY